MGPGSLRLVQAGIMRSWTDVAGFTVVSSSGTAQKYSHLMLCLFEVGKMVSIVQFSVYSSL
jgi:hypothetical protein